MIRLCVVSLSKMKQCFSYIEYLSFLTFYIVLVIMHCLGDVYFEQQNDWPNNVRIIV